MHIRLIAVGDRQPSWVDQAFRDYASRLPRQWRFSLLDVPTARRGKRGNAVAAQTAESKQLLARLGERDTAVLLDERGEQFSSTELASRLGKWQIAGRDICFVIGGPDGVSEEITERADLVWSLSRLTLPHGLARVMFIEQLYRAWTISNNHPYHRE